MHEMGAHIPVNASATVLHMHLLLETELESRSQKESFGTETTNTISKLLVMKTKLPTVLHGKVILVPKGCGRSSGQTDSQML